MMPSNKQPIAIYDSGVGGLSVLRAIRAELPYESLLYLGDQAHVPYGQRSLEELRGLAEAVSAYFLKQEAKLIVVACNTASAAALKQLREVYPQVPFVGMEPAVKPASEHTQSGKVGVLATPATFAGELYASVVERFAQHVEVHQATCPGLVAQIEEGALRTAKTRRILQEAIEPMLAAGVDNLVMGCTHYPFVIPLIEEIVDGRAQVIDPSPAVARQVRRVLESLDLEAEGPGEGQMRYYTTADPQKMQRFLNKVKIKPGQVQQLTWQNGELKEEEER